MPDSTKSLPKALAAGTAIGLIVLGLFASAGVTTGLLGLPLRLDLPLPLRLMVAAVLLAGLGLALWLFKYRSPQTMIVSTYYTFVKMFTRAPASKLEGRTEPLKSERALEGEQGDQFQLVSPPRSSTCE